MSKLLITVLMPVYNAENHLRMAIDSILSQSFTDFEFLIINDGSTDNSEKIITSYHDSRLRYYKNKSQLRLVQTLNKGLELAEGQYIARMDADDIAVSYRLEKQLLWMQSHPEVGVCGSFVETFGKQHKTWNYPIFDAQIRVNMLLNNPFCHSSVMLRKSVLDTHDLRYASNYEYCEDYDFWIRASAVTKFYNIPKILMYYRLHDNQITHSKKEFYSEKVHKLRALQLTHLLPSVDASSLAILDDLAKYKFPNTSKKFLKMGELLHELKRQNQNKFIYDVPTFNEMLFWRCWLPMVRFFRKETKNYTFLVRFIIFSPFFEYYLRSRMEKYLARRQNED